MALSTIRESQEEALHQEPHQLAPLILDIFSSVLTVHVCCLSYFMWKKSLAALDG